jgi:GDP-4-dehydro-6-deoxy-D-mannose reductase
MTVLVTGATGALGRVLAARVSAHSCEAVVASSRTAAASGDHAACDLTDRDAVRALVRRVRPALVYHLAGSYSNRYDADYAINAQAAMHLLDAILEERLAARVVVIGSAAEYGPIRPQENPVCEDHVLRPVSVYGLTKAFQTQIASLYAHRGADVVVARMFNLLAPGMSEHLFVGRIERLIAEYRAGDIATIDVGRLDHQRDYVTAEDAAAQIELIARNGRRGEVYHVASGRPVVMRDLLHRMLAEAGIARSDVRENAAAGVRTGYDAPLVYADMQRTRSLAQLQETQP